MVATSSPASGNAALEAYLRRYRAKPNDRTFAAVYGAGLSWLRAVAGHTVKQYPSLCLDIDLDYVANEGALALSRAARRYLYFCPECGEAFLQRRDLVAHGANTHRIRGASELVTLGTFAQANARLAMRRTARRLCYPEDLTDRIALEGVDDGLETRVLLRLLVESAEKRLCAEAVDLLSRILSSDVPEPVELSDLLLEIRAYFADVRGSRGAA